MQPDLFGDVLVAELDTDRLQLNRYLAFIKEYASRVGTDDLRELNTGIDARTQIDIQFPRPLVDADVEAMLKLGIVHAETDMESVAAELVSEFAWITGYQVPTQGIAIVQHVGGPNDLVQTQTLELIEEMNRFGIGGENITVSCGVVER